MWEFLEVLVWWGGRGQCVFVHLSNQYGVSLKPYSGGEECGGTGLVCSLSFRIVGVFTLPYGLWLFELNAGFLLVRNKKIPCKAHVFNSSQGWIPGGDGGHGARKYLFDGPPN